MVVKARLDVRIQGRDGLDDALAELRHSIVRALSAEAFQRDAVQVLQEEIDGSGE